MFMLKLVSPPSRTQQPIQFQAIDGQRFHLEGSLGGFSKDKKFYMWAIQISHMGAQLKC